MDGCFVSSIACRMFGWHVLSISCVKRDAGGLDLTCCTNTYGPRTASRLLTLFTAGSARGQMAVLLANTTYRPALQRLVDNGSMEGAQQDWSVLEGLRSVV